MATPRPKKSSQTFIMKSLPVPSKFLPEFKTEEASAYAAQYIKDEYHWSLIKACIVSSGANVVSLHTKPTLSVAGEHENMQVFARDFAVLLPDKKLILAPKNYLEEHCGDFFHTAAKQINYQLMEVENAFFEGGNVQYVQELGVLLHGLDPVGGYMKEGGYFGHYYPIKPADTTKKLAEILEPHKIEVVGIDLKYSPFHVSAISTHYYHLDCFMQLLPDGRLFLLNKDLLTEESYAKLVKIFGEKLIDLEYKDYLSNPVLLNFVTIPTEAKETICVSPSLPPSLHAALKSKSLTVLTPDVLDKKSQFYDKAVCEKVATALVADGYNPEEVNPEELLLAIPTRMSGYKVDTGDTYPATLRKLAEQFEVPADEPALDEETELALDKVGDAKLDSEHGKDVDKPAISKKLGFKEIIALSKPFNFMFQSGSVHCMTFEADSALSEYVADNKFESTGKP